jgi:hypothetical protein
VCRCSLVAKSVGRQPGTFDVFGMTSSMFAAANRGEDLGGVSNWTVLDTQCFDVQGASTPAGVDPFLVVFRCARAPGAASTPEFTGDTVVVPRCSIDVGFNFTKACTPGAPGCASHPLVEGIACQVPALRQSSVVTHVIQGDDVFGFHIDRCGQNGSCTNVNISIVAWAGSSFDVFALPMSAQKRWIELKNMTHAHYYSILDDAWRTAEPMPARVAALAERIASEKTAAARREAASKCEEGDSECNDGEAPSEAGIDLQADVEFSEKDGTVTATMDSLDSIFTPPQDHVDPAFHELARPTACWEREMLTTPLEAGNAMLMLIHCSRPRNGKCIVTIHHEREPNPTDPEAIAAKRLLEEEEEVRRGMEGRQSFGEDTEAPPEVSAEERQEQFRSTEECAAFAALKEKAGSPPKSEDSAPPSLGIAGPTGITTGHLSLIEGASAIVATVPDCYPSKACGHSRVAVAMWGEEGEGSLGGKVATWATTLSGFRNATHHGLGVEKMGEGTNTLPCSAASTRDRPWPKKWHRLDGGVFWMVQCLQSPMPDQSCEIDFVVEAVRETSAESI